MSINEVLEVVLDGELHVAGECCANGSILGRGCRTAGCSGRLHQQPVYGGIAELCEVCHRDDWRPRGTYTTDATADGIGAAGSFTV